MAAGSPPGLLYMRWLMHCRLWNNRPTVSGSNSAALYEQPLREQIVRPFVPTEPSSGTWHGHMLIWLESDGAPLSAVRYEAPEDLNVEPRGVVPRAVSVLGLDIVANRYARVLPFGELHGIDREFDRSGGTTNWASRGTQGPVERRRA